MILFQWTGYAPREKGGRTQNVSCAAAFPSQAAFFRATDSTRSRLPYIAMVKNPGDPHNEGARMALKNPGVVYYQDTVHHAPRDAPWLVHPDPKRA